jgi:hypothetical protein
VDIYTRLQVAKIYYHSFHLLTKGEYVEVLGELYQEAKR